MTSISAFIITCDRPQMLRACLRRARFADQLIMVDKSATEEGRRAARRAVASVFDCRYREAEWTPVVEDTREFAQSLCTGDWIICLDDDEILSPDAGRVFREIAEQDEIQIAMVPMRHYVLGRHDPRGMPDEYRPTFYKRGAIQYSATVHAGNVMIGRPVVQLAPGGPCYIDHYSHPDIASFIEKTNRYTSVPQRAGARMTPYLGEFARQKLSQYLDACPRDSRLEMVAILRAFYEIMDVGKRWEDTQPNGHEIFRRMCMEIESGR